MADLSKIKLNGVNYNIKDEVARTTLNNMPQGLATANSDGFMSSTDKMTLDTLSGGTKEEKTITDIGSSILIDDALPEELIGCEFTVYPRGDIDNPTGGGNNLLNPATNI